MKNVFSILLLSIVCSMCLAQNYSIYDWKGKVLLKEDNGQSWFPVKKEYSVSDRDSVDIARKGFLRVIDNRNNLIYQSIKPGKFQIIELIQEVQMKKSSIMVSVNRELMKNAKEPPIKERELIMMGATTRGRSDTMMIPNKIAQTFGWIAAQALHDRLVSNDSSIFLKKHIYKNGTIYFEIKNQMNRGYFVNVLHLNKSTKKISLCYVINEEQALEAPYLYLPEHKTLLMKNLLFNFDKQNDVFILVGTEDGYIPEQMQFVLQYMDIERATPLYDKYVYYIQ